MAVRPSSDRANRKHTALLFIRRTESTAPCYLGIAIAADRTGPGTATGYPIHVTSYSTCSPSPRASPLAVRMIYTESTPYLRVPYTRLYGCRSTTARDDAIRSHVAHPQWRSEVRTIVNALMANVPSPTPTNPRALTHVKCMTRESNGMLCTAPSPSSAPSR